MILIENYKFRDPQFEMNSLPARNNTSPMVKTIDIVDIIDAEVCNMLEKEIPGFFF